MPNDTVTQLKRYLQALDQQRQMLEPQREDSKMPLSEIAAHEAECRHLLTLGKAGGGAVKTEN